MKSKDKDRPLKKPELELCNKKVIIELIKQDMHFNQYLAALRKLGIEVYDFELDLIGVVARLMGVKDEDMTDSWTELYVQEIEKCQNVPIEPPGKNLYPLAEECYRALLNFKAADARLT